jgi:mannitol/fructose-specific phosphotransferase system IIA component (Ntr-type)
MHLREYFEPELIKLRLESTSRDDVIRELVSMLNLDAEVEERLCRQFIRQQNLGSTGIGRGIAFVYGRTPDVSELRVGFGRQPDGIDFTAIDGKPVCYVFLKVGPPGDIPSEYLPVMGKLAQFFKEPDVPNLLAKVETVEDFLQVIDAKDKG